MTEPILVVQAQITSEQRAEIKRLTPNYRILDAAEITEENRDDVEILYGWNGKHPLIGSEWVETAPSHLKWIQTVSAGVDHLPLAHLAQQNILLSNGSGIHSIPITESVLGMLLAHARSIQAALAEQAKKNWAATLPYDELSEKSMVIVGTGKIGQQLAKVARAFDLDITGVNRSGHAVAHFDHILSQKELPAKIGAFDIVVTILPLTDETYHYYDDALFQNMKKGVWFINVGRGATVSTAALTTALASEQIGFAGLDVFEEEPLPTSSSLWTAPNVLITPHISGQARHYKERLFAIFSKNLQSFYHNQTLSENQVDLQHGY